MASHPDHHSKWTGNQKILLAINLVFGSLLILGLVKALISGTPGTDLAAGLFCYLVFTAPFAFGLAVSRRKARLRHRRNMHVTQHRKLIPEGFAEVTVSEQERLPLVCVCCGRPGSRTTPIRHKTASSAHSPYDWRRIHPLFMIVLFWKWTVWLVGAKLVEWFEGFTHRWKSSSSNLLFLIPHCASCAKTQPVMQRHLDFHGRKITLAACRNFILALHEMRKKE